MKINRKRQVRILKQLCRKYHLLCLNTQSVHERPLCLHPCQNGHTFLHDLTVAAHVIAIAPNDTVMEKAFCAAMLHSFDYLYGEMYWEQAIESDLFRICGDQFTARQLREIAQAAIRHKERNHVPRQSLTQRVLMDADRLTGMMDTMFLNLAKCAPARPTLELTFLEANMRGEMNPLSTYGQPLSTLDNMLTHLWYLPNLRLPKAKVLGQVYAGRMKEFASRIHREHAILGLAGFKFK